MPQLHKTATTIFTPTQLFDLVMDVGQYPEFLPFCTHTHIYETSDTHMLADMSIGYKAFSGTFRSKINLLRPNRIHIEQDHGSLKHLESEWKFEAIPTGSNVYFSIDFEPKSWLLKKLISPILNEMGEVMLDRFIQRAEKIFL